MELKVRLHHPKAQLPTKAYDGDAGWDLYSVISRSCSRYESIEVDTGVSVEIPEGYFGLIGTRSSMGKKGMLTHPGIIDSGFRGKITVFLRNLGYATDIYFGDKIAQLLILPVPEVTIKQVEYLTPSTRGEKGVGSSGR